MKNNVNKNTVKKGLLPYLFITLIIITIFYFVNVMNNSVKVLSYDEFMKELNDNHVTELEVVTRGGAYTYEVRGTLKGYKENETFFARLPYSEQVMKKIISASDKQEFKMEVKADPDSSAWLVIFVNVFPILIFIVAAFFLFSRQVAGNKSSLDFGKSRAKLNADTDKVTFNDVAGLKEEKEELKELIDFLKNPKKFQNLELEFLKVFY